jgi:hypothetical protein
MGKIKAIKGLGKAFEKRFFPNKKAAFAVGAGGVASTDAFMEKDKFKKAYEKSKKNKNKKNDR